MTMSIKFDTLLIELLEDLKEEIDNDKKRLTALREEHFDSYGEPIDGDVYYDDSEEEERIARAEERYTKLCIEQDEGGPVYD